jgi:hypothetical protein
MDFKEITLKLFGENVVVRIKYGTFSFIHYGSEIKGRIVGRVWGERLHINQLTQKEEKFNTVIAVLVMTDKEEEIELKSEDIESILAF